MANIDEIQKVNEMAQELLRNKVAIDLDDAMEKSQKILNISLGPRVSATTGGVQQNPQPTPQPVNNSFNTEPQMVNQVQSQAQVSQNSNQNDLCTYAQMVQEIEQLKATMNQGLSKLYDELKKVIDFAHGSIKNDLKVSNNSRPQMQSQSQRPQQMQQPQVQQQAQMQQAQVQQQQPQMNQQSNVEQITIEEKKENNPRQGGFAPGDDKVSIDKIFYYGNK